jgi:hypothetical protein
MKLNYNEALEYVRNNKISCYTYNSKKEEVVVLEFAEEGHVNENNVLVCIFDSGGDDFITPSELQKDYPDYISRQYSPFTFEDYRILEMDLALIEMRKSEL